MIRCGVVAAGTAERDRAIRPNRRGRARLPPPHHSAPQRGYVCVDACVGGRTPHTAAPASAPGPSSPPFRAPARPFASVRAPALANANVHAHARARAHAHSVGAVFADERGWATTRQRRWSNAGVECSGPALSGPIRRGHRAPPALRVAPAALPGRPPWPAGCGMLFVCARACVRLCVCARVHV